MEHQTENQQPQSRVTKRRTNNVVNYVWLGVFVAIILIAAITYAAGSRGDKAANVTQRSSVANDGNKLVSQTEQTISTVADQVSPSVVSITMTAQARTGNRFQPIAQSVGAGTGVIVSKDGYILTNKHVVDGATSVSVTTSDGEIYDNVKVLGADPLNDLAYLKVANVSNLKPADLGDSSTVRVGQHVIAIGNSLGRYQNTVTSGIISGTGRPITASSEDGTSSDSLVDLLQTDAAINPGNSGGPLLNSSGQVVGINTAVAADAQGIGFSIPINAAKGMLKQVLAGKSPERAYLGVQYVSLSKAVAKEYNVPLSKGAYVIGNGRNTPVVPNSPADKAGIKEKDVITKINNIEVGSVAGFSSLIAEYAPGDTVSLTVVRDGATLTKQVQLESFRQ